MAIFFLFFSAPGISWLVISDIESAKIESNPALISSSIDTSNRLDNNSAIF